MLVLGRMPQLDPNRPRYADADDREVRASPIVGAVGVVAPYQPLKSTARVELPPLHTTASSRELKLKLERNSAVHRVK